MILFERNLKNICVLLKARSECYIQCSEGGKEIKNLISTLKLGDIIVIILLLLISLFPFAIFTWQQAQIDGEKLIAVISVKNEVIETINLSDHEGHEQFDITTHDHEINTVELSDGRIRIKSATCNDQVCVRTGFINKAGQTIVCLPHQLVIEVQNLGDDNPEDDLVDIISS